MISANVSLRQKAILYFPTDAHWNVKEVSLALGQTMKVLNGFVGTQPQQKHRLMSCDMSLATFVLNTC